MVVKVSVAERESIECFKLPCIVPFFCLTNNCVIIDSQESKEPKDAQEAKAPIEAVEIKGEKRKSDSDNEEGDEFNNHDSFGIPLSFTDRHSRAEEVKERNMEKKW